MDDAIRTNVETWADTVAVPPRTVLTKRPGGGGNPRSPLFLVLSSFAEARYGN